MKNEKYVIISDSNCDLDDDIRKEYDIFDYVNGHITLPNGENTYSYLDWRQFTPDEFYTTLKNNPNGYTTCPASIDEFAEKFEKYVKDGYGVLCIEISSGLSGAYNFALSAKAQVLAKYPDAKIEVIDSLRFGPGLGLLIVNAAKLRLEGKSLEEVAKYVEENKMKYHQMGWLDDLSFVAKKGRISNAKAFFGTLIGIKPLGEQDYNGLTTTIGKAKGEKGGLDAIIGYMEKTIENPKDQLIIIATTQRMASAEKLKVMIEEKFNPKQVIIKQVYASCGVNIGPGLMAAYYIGKPITQGLVEETKIMTDLLAAK